MNILEQKNQNKECTACSACEAICSRGAIRLKQNNEGFYYPDVSVDTCINCGMCKTVCPLFKEWKTVIPLEAIRACSRTEKKRMQGSSGGIFPELAFYINSQGGVVYGVAFDRKKKQAQYCGSDEVSLDKLFRSKYVEASDDNSFHKVKHQLDNGRIVLYCGTPCKIQGLLSYLKHDYPNLYTVDFVCHGKPSAGLLSDVIRDEEILAGEKCVDVTFREKIKGWRKQMIAFYFFDRSFSVYESSHYYYYYYFLHNYSLRKSCVNCGCYKKHYADITMSDSWSMPKNIDDDKGMSLVFVNSEKGKEFIKNIHEKLNILEHKSHIAGEMEAYAHTFRKGYSIQKRDRFFQLYKKRGINYIKKEGYNKILKKEARKQAIYKGLLRIRTVLKEEC